MIQADGSPKKPLGGIDPGPIRAFLAETVCPIDPARLVVSDRQVPSTLCYLRHDGHLLMLNRIKEPFSEHWTAPGGKIKDGETPHDAIVREMKEETGLDVFDLELKVVCSETGDDRYYNWLLFVFEAHGYRGELTSCDEGELRWLPLDDLANWKLPDVDRRIMRYVLDDADSPWYMRVRYGADHSVADLQVRKLMEFCD